MFPDTYFEFSSTIYPDAIPYEDYDISLYLFCDNGDLTNGREIRKPYVCRKITSFPLYFWVSATSPWAVYRVLDFSLLQNHTCCLLKSHFDKSMIAAGIYTFANLIHAKAPRNVEIADNLIKNIELYDCYTIDMKNEPFHDLLLKDLFAGHNIIVKPSPYNFSLVIIYKETQQNFCNAIANFF